MIEQWEEERKERLVCSWLDSTVPESTCLLMQHSPTTPQEMRKKKERKDTEGGKKRLEIERERTGKRKEAEDKKKDVRHRQTHMKIRKGNI